MSGGIGRVRFREQKAVKPIASERSPTLAPTLPYARTPPPSPPSTSSPTSSSTASTSSTPCSRRLVCLLLHSHLAAASRGNAPRRRAAALGSWARRCGRVLDIPNPPRRGRLSASASASAPGAAAWRASAGAWADPRLRALLAGGHGLDLVLVASDAVVPSIRNICAAAADADAAADGAKPIAIGAFGDPEVGFVLNAAAVRALAAHRTACATGSAPAACLAALGLSPPSRARGGFGHPSHDPLDRDGHSGLWPAPGSVIYSIPGVLRAEHHTQLDYLLSVTVARRRPTTQRPPRILCFGPVAWDYARNASRGGQLDALMGTWGTRCDGVAWFTPDVSRPALGVRVLPLANGTHAELAKQSAAHRKRFPVPDACGGDAARGPPADRAWRFRAVARRGCKPGRWLMPADLWTLTQNAWTYVHEHLRDEYDWFFKVDDDSYVLVENLRAAVAALDPREPHFLGHTLWATKEPVNAGAGYVLSRGGLDALAPTLPSSPRYAGRRRHRKCTPTGTWAEDGKFSTCLRALGIRPRDTRDARRRETFHNLDPAHHLAAVRTPGSTWWFWKNKPNDTRGGVDCCSDAAVMWSQFKGASGARKMRVLDRLLHAPAHGDDVGDK